MMIILTLYIILHQWLTKNSGLVFIGCHNVQLGSCWMVVTTSVREPPWDDNVQSCALTFSYHIHYVNSDLRCHFLNNGYGVFPSLRCTTYYMRTMYAYNLCIYFYFSFISMLYPVLYHSVSTLHSCISPPVSMLDSIYFWSDLNFNHISNTLAQI